MIKRLLLITTCFAATSHDMRSTSGSDVVVAVGATACVGGIVYASCYRETNQAKIDRAYHVIDTYEIPMRNALCSMNSFEGLLAFRGATQTAQYAILHHDVMQAYDGIANRYQSYLKPWNWSASMRSAYEDIKELKDMVVLFDLVDGYQDLLNCINKYQGQELDKELLSVVRKRYGMPNAYNVSSRYPLINVVRCILADIEMLSKMRFSGAVAHKILLKELRAVVGILTSSDAYLTEMREKAAYELEQAKLRAAEEQAQAQRDQARAQKRQADALEESNRIKKKKYEDDFWKK